VVHAEFAIAWAYVSLEESNCVFLCVVMWAQYTSEDAARELVQALHSDEDVVVLASALLEGTASSSF
jgi:hypothetical protein